MLEFEKIASEYTKPGDPFFYVKIKEDYFKVWPVELISVELLREKPANYAVVSEEELRCCPTLVKLMNDVREIEKEIEKNKENGNEKRVTGKHLLKVSLEEFEKVKRLIEEKGNVLEFGGDYFIVFVDCSVHMKKVVIPECVKVTENELQTYPALKKALIAADKKGSAGVKVPPVEWEETMDFVRGKRCIRFNGSNFAIQFMLA